MRFSVLNEKDELSMLGKPIKLRPIVVRFKDEIPITWNYYWNRKPIGRMTDIKLEGASIAGEVEWLDPNVSDDTPKNLGCRLYGYYTNLQYDEGRHEVLECTLRAATLHWDEMSGPANPGASIR